METRPSQDHDRPDVHLSAIHRHGRARQTVQWPFQSVATFDSIPTVFTDHSGHDQNQNPLDQPAMPALPPAVVRDLPALVRPSQRTRPRPLTWQPRKTTEDDEDTRRSSRLELPDYVINYLRGETPETLARRKAEREQQALQKTLEAYRLKQERDLQAAGEEYQARLRGGGSPETFGSGETDEKRRRQSGGSWASTRVSLSCRSVLSRGWRGGMAGHAAISVLLLGGSLAGLMVAMADRRWGGSSSSSSAGTAAIYSGSCTCAQAIHLGLRAVFAVVAAAVLAAAQYVFHVLSSPTRAELDAAHARRRWLDLGVPSLRNICFLLGHRDHFGGGGSSRARAALALVAVAAALASVVLYGGLVFVAEAVASVPDYTVALVTPSFLTGAAFGNSSATNAAGLDRPTLLRLQQLAVGASTTLTTLSAEDCLQTSPKTALQQEIALFQVVDSHSAFQPALAQAVLLVLNEEAQSASGSLIQTAPAGSPLVAQSTGSDGVFSIGTSVVVNASSLRSCIVQAKSSSTINHNNTCSVTLNTPILAALVGLHGLAATILGTALLRQGHRHFRQAPLITLGDAIASFLHDPDPTTRGACLLTKSDVWKGRWKAMAHPSVAHENILQAMFWEPSKAGSARMRWSCAPSLPRWLAGSLVWLALAGLAAAGLASAFDNSTRRLGALGQFPISLALYGASGPATTALVAALPQLGLGLLYLVVDAHLCICFVSDESAGYARGPAGLRVSHHPRGFQNATRHLAVPPFWRLLLLALFAGLFWAAGTGMVVEAVQSAASAATHRLVLLGFSTAGLVAVLALLGAVAVLVLGLALRTIPPAYARDGTAIANPLALPDGPCSAVVSSRCHPVPDEVANTGGISPALRAASALPLWLRPLAWGAVPTYHHHYGPSGETAGTGSTGNTLDIVIGHATFSSRPVGALDPVRSYA